MSLKYLSHYGVIVGLVPIVVTIMFLVDGSNHRELANIEKTVKDFGWLIIMPIFSVALFVGIAGKTCWLILPAFIYGLGTSLYFSFMGYRPAYLYGHLPMFIVPGMQLGLEIIILYPIFYLFLQLYRARAVSTSKKGHIIEATTKVAVQ